MSLPHRKRLQPGTNKASETVGTKAVLTTESSRREKVGAKLYHNDVNRLAKHATEQAGLIGVRSTKSAQWSELRRQISDFIVKWARPYQLRWLQDRAKQKAAHWCRRAGKSSTIALESDLYGMEPPKSSDYVVAMMSAGDTPAKELLLKAVTWSNIFDDIAKRVVGRSIYYKPPSASQIQFWNGNRLLSLPANPATAAGFTGDALWDEASKTPHDRLVFDARHPMIPTAPHSTMRMRGPAWGDKGICYDGFHGRLGAKGDWSLHTIDLPLAIKEGDPRDIAWIRKQYDSLTFAQNYLCKFVSTATSVFPPELILACRELELPGVPKKLEGLPFKPRVVIGCDVGRRSDLSSAVWAVEWPQGFYRVDHLITLDNVPFAEQEQRFASAIESDDVEAFVPDETGLGMHLAENLRARFPGKVKPVMFNNTVKNQMVNTVLGLMEGGRIRLPDDDRLIDDFSSIRRELLPGGGLKYYPPRNQRGHADTFTAFALAIQYLHSTAGEWRMTLLGDDPLGGAGGSYDAGVDIRGALPRAASGSEFRLDVGGYTRLPTAEDLGGVRVDDETLARLNACKSRREQDAILDELGYFG